MGQALAIETVRADLRRVADLGVDAATGRYPTADCNRWINKSYRRLRELASGNGHQLYLKQSTPATFTTGVLANTSFGTIPMPADCVAIYGIDVVLSATEVRSLYPADWNQRNSFYDGYGQLPGVPEAFHIYNAGVESVGSVGTGTVAIFPAPRTAWTYTTWYLPTWTDITDGSVFNVINGWDAFLIWDSAIAFLSGDNDRLNAYGIATTERAKAEELIKSRATRMQRAGSGTRRDVRSEVAMVRAGGLWRLP